MFINYLRYHKRRLPPTQQIGYDAVERAILRMDSDFTVGLHLPYATPDAIWDILVAVYNDNPSYYYFTPTRYSTVQSGANLVVSLQYLYPIQEARGLEQILATFLKDFYRRHVKPGMADEQKTMLIHDFLVSTIKYDYESLNNANGDLDVFNILGALVKRRAVCWGIAMAFKLLCDYLSVPCIVVPGDGIFGGTSEKHAWNMVLLDGDWYHVDATWDLRTKGDEERVYDYYNLDDRMIGGDHDWDRTFYPSCDGFKHNYFYACNAFVSSPAQIQSFYSRMLDKGSFRTILKYRGTLPDTDTIMQEIEHAVRVYAQTRQIASMPYEVRVDRGLKNIYARFGREVRP